MTTTIDARVHPVCPYFAGGASTADDKWGKTMAALQKLSKADPVLALIWDDLDDAWADCLEEAARYGHSVGCLGSDVSVNADDWTPEEREARLGAT